MPSKKKKYNARFPAGRIKKIMQTDEEVGKVAQAVPIIISRTLELFVHSLLTKAMQITSARNAKTLSPSHMKQCILSENRFDFLKDLVKSLPDVSVHDDEVPTPPLTPAPVSSNLSNTSCASVARYTEVLVPKVSIAESSTDHRTTKRDTGGSNLSTEKDPLEAPSPPVPQFQISVPPSFNINQPNFYTEVNTPSISTNTPAINASNPPTSNFAHTANLDEDYDT